jgi:hypothetical protein
MEHPPDQVPEPPPQYAAYPRHQAHPVLAYGSADRLRSLYSGYQGLNAVFLLNIVLAIGIGMGAGTVRSPEGATLLYLGGLGMLFVTVAVGTYFPNKRIAYGANWAPAMAYLASFLMALNSILCCGIIGYVVMQQLAANEMKKYGLKSHFLGGIRKAEVEDVARQLESLHRNGPIPPAPGY